MKHFWSIHKKALLFFAITVILFFINAFHEQYPDEFDNIVGGWFILHGTLPFVGFFSHHGPVAYFVSAFVQIFSGHSFVTFRIVYDIMLALGVFAWYLYLQSRFGKIATNSYLYFSILLAIAATYFWGHMLVADSLASYFLTFCFVYFLLSFIYREKITLSDIAFISLFTCAALLTALTYIYLCFIIYATLLFLYYRGQQGRARIINMLKAVLLLIMPYFIFLIYLLLTRSLSDYVYQSIIFNQKYYIYNYPNIQDGHINPLRFAIVIFHQFFSNFFTILVQVKDFQFIFPFNVTLAIINVTVLVYLLFRRQFLASVFIILYMVYANARSSPLDIKETDYQSSVYIMMSLFNLCYILPALFHEIQMPLHYGKKVILSGLFILCLVYSFFTVGLLSNKFLDKAYNKYMGFAPLIYDRPDYAPIINAVTDKNDYFWIGPLEFQEYYYIHTKLASKYFILIPGMGHSTKIQQEFIADLQQHQPKIIVFKKNFTILGYDPKKYGVYFTNYLNDNYFTLHDYASGGVRYVSVASVNDKVNLETDLYINKNNKDAVINSLLAGNFIKPVYASEKNVSSPPQTSKK